MYTYVYLFQAEDNLFDFSNAQNPFSVKFDKNRTSPLANSFIPMTSRDWNSDQATAPTDIFESCPAHKIPSSSSFHDGEANPSL